jgi:hypothetical protein
MRSDCASTLQRLRVDSATPQQSYCAEIYRSNSAATPQRLRVDSIAHRLCSDSVAIASCTVITGILIQDSEAPRQYYCPSEMKFSGEYLLTTMF